MLGKSRRRLGRVDPQAILLGSLMGRGFSFSLVSEILRSVDH